MKRFSSESQRRGLIGEEIACMFLVKQGFSIIDRNVTKRWGEIDVIAKKQGILHFIEVKLLRNKAISDVSRETGPISPLENITFFKLERMKRTVMSWFLDRNVSHETPFQIDGISVLYNPETKEARVKMLENINII